MEEKWRPVAGYEGLYEVSNLRRIKYLERVVTYTRVRSRLKHGDSLRALNLHCTPTAASSTIPEHIVRPKSCKSGKYVILISSDSIRHREWLNDIVHASWPQLQVENQLSG